MTNRDFTADPCCCRHYTFWRGRCTACGITWDQVRPTTSTTPKETPMTDRDLIAEGRRFARHAADEQPYVGKLRDILTAALDALEAAQRPPLGYADGALFAAIRSLSVSGRPVDPVTVAATLDAQGVLTLTGGAGYLALLSVARLP